MERPRIEQFQDETTYSMDWVRYFESMRIYCAAIESKLIESNRRLVAEEMESIALQERIDALEVKLKLARKKTSLRGIGCGLITVIPGHMVMTEKCNVVIV